MNLVKASTRKKSPRYLNSMCFHIKKRKVHDLNLNKTFFDIKKNSRNDHIRYTRNIIMFVFEKQNTRRKKSSDKTTHQPKKSRPCFMCVFDDKYGFKK